MPSLSVVRAANLATVPKYRPTALFLGGTSGIGKCIHTASFVASNDSTHSLPKGQGVAEALAQVTNGNSHIIICGRNKAAADKIIEGFPKASDSTYEFEQCDATLMSNVRNTTASLVGRLPKLNYLVLSPG